jgi:hypothetical protein
MSASCLTANHITNINTTTIIIVIIIIIINQALACSRTFVFPLVR